MSEVTRRQRTAAAAAWACVVVLTVPGVVLSILAWRYLATSDAVSNLAGLPAAILYATLGALVVRRAANVVGWFLLNGGAASAVGSAASAYAVLADHGLPAALRAQAGRAPVPVLVEADGIGRLSRDAEATLYFCILEALQNVAKYAQASLATVTLTQVGGRLDFSVTDDGTGFDPAGTVHGTGLPGMADRLSAVGGKLGIASAPGRGTTISGTVPVAALAPALAD